jgi:hypothetical protein
MRELGPWLARSYGASDRYTPAQVRAGLARLALPPEYAWLGHAAFLTEAEFAQLAPVGSHGPSHAEARAVLQRHRPRRAASAGGDFHESGIGQSGWYFGDSHHGGFGGGG